MPISNLKQQQPSVLIFLIENVKNKIKTEALRLGFSACGLSKVEVLEEQRPFLNNYLAKAMNGEMTYISNHLEKRLNPELLVEGAKTVISVLLNYFPEKTQNPNAPILSKYAYGMDYHIVLKDRLQKLFDYINTEITPINGRIFTDSAPVLDKAWAIKSGLGWLGKNGMLLTKKGSFFFVGEIICDLDLERFADISSAKAIKNAMFSPKGLYDTPINEYCGTCTRCIEACPTQAIEAPYIVNGSKCISYLTIELKGEIPLEFKGKLNDRMYGCDICQEVCPWNNKAVFHSIEEFQPNDEILNMSREDWYSLSPEKFSSLFKNSAVKRTKYKGLMRNLNFLK